MPSLINIDELPVQCVSLDPSEVGARLEDLKPLCDRIKLQLAKLPKNAPIILKTSANCRFISNNSENNLEEVIEDFVSLYLLSKEDTLIYQVTKLKSEFSRSKISIERLLVGVCLKLNTYLSRMNLQLSTTNRDKLAKILAEILIEINPRSYPEDFRLLVVRLNELVRNLVDPEVSKILFRYSLT